MFLRWIVEKSQSGPWNFQFRFVYVFKTLRWRDNRIFRTKKQTSGAVQADVKDFYKIIEISPDIFNQSCFNNFAKKVFVSCHIWLGLPLLACRTAKHASTTLANIFVNLYTRWELNLTVFLKISLEINNQQAHRECWKNITREVSVMKSSWRSSNPRVENTLLSLSAGTQWRKLCLSTIIWSKPGYDFIIRKTKLSIEQFHSK